jgi:DNA-binding transcriptional regulator YiaG
MTRAQRLTWDQRVALHAARAAEGLTRAQLAVALGVDPSTVARWEEGVSYPSPMALSALRARFPGVGL